MTMRTTVVIALCATLIVACSADPDGPARPATPVTTTTPAPTTSPPTVPATTSAPTTTLPVTTGVVLPPDLGQLVSSAPGVTTPGDIWQLAPRLWLFLPSESAGDPNLTPPRPEDAEILIAYARKQRALNLAASSDPMNLNSAELRAAYTQRGLEGRVGALERLANGYLQLSDGIVFRPRVLSEPRSSTSAIIFDCLLDSSFFAESGSRQPLPGEVSGPRRTAVFAGLVNISGSWLVELDGPEDLACV
jgi:hypothetical protein